MAGALGRHHYSPRSGEGALDGAGAHGRGGAFRLARDGHAEGATALAALQPDATAVQLGEGLGDGQAHAHARHSPPSPVATAVEGLEDVLLLLVWYAGAGIGHGDDNFIVICPYLYGNASLSGGESVGVGEKVNQDLLEAIPVGDDGGTRSVESSIQRLMAGDDQGVHQGGSGSHHPA